MATHPRPKMGAAVLRRATKDTKFHIDFDWWDRSGLDLKAYLYSRLDIPKEQFSEDMKHDEVDIVDPETGEVRRVDGFQFLMQAYLNQVTDSFLGKSSLVDAVFFVLLANANQPMRVADIARKVQRPTDVVLKMLSGRQIYQGIRPVYEEDE